MEKRTVKRNIFLSNALMVVVTLLIFLMINLFVIKIYAESIDAEFRNSVESVEDEDGLADLLEDWTVHRNEFIFIFGADAVVCIIVFLIISQIFTKKLADHIMEPLDALAEGAERIRKNDLSQDIVYTGELEFENVCAAFNDMQASILAEQEKNRKYEKARTDMIAGISHDLRTPLTAMKGTIKGLLDGVASAPEQQKKFLQAAYRRTGDMDVLLNQLLYLSRMETGNVPISMQTIEMGEFLLSYAKGKRDVIDRGQEEISVDTQNITAKAWIDPEQFQRILDNLVENSRKYAEAAPLKMEMKLKKAPAGLCVCFRDNGVGVPEEIKIRDLRILVNSWKVYKGDKEIKFPNREFEVLKFFAMNPNIVFSKEQIYEKIWGYDYMGDSATVMVHINRIREKLRTTVKILRSWRPYGVRDTG